MHGEPHEHFPRQNREGLFAAAFFLRGILFLRAAFVAETGFFVAALRAEAFFPLGATFFVFFTDFALAM
ncbi:MAG: hypothetical protein PT977_10385 [Acidobacteriota bacterium]|nr:hypothetical protein [Acidobacteriota bacterium]